MLLCYLPTVSMPLQRGTQGAGNGKDSKALERVRMRHVGDIVVKDVPMEEILPLHGCLHCDADEHSRGKFLRQRVHPVRHVLNPAVCVRAASHVAETPVKIFVSTKQQLVLTAQQPGANRAARDSGGSLTSQLVAVAGP